MPQSTNLNILLSGCCKFYAALTAKDVRSQEKINFEKLKASILPEAFEPCEFATVI
jgi:hypothetical protein